MWPNALLCKPEKELLCTVNPGATWPSKVQEKQTPYLNHGTWKGGVMLHPRVVPSATAKASWTTMLTQLQGVFCIQVQYQLSACSDWLTLESINNQSCHHADFVVVLVHALQDHYQLHRSTKTDEKASNSNVNKYVGQVVQCISRETYPSYSLKHLLWMPDWV